MGKVLQFKLKSKEQRSREAAIKAIKARVDKLAWAKQELLKEAEKLDW